MILSGIPSLSAKYLASKRGGNRSKLESNKNGGRKKSKYEPGVKVTVWGCTGRKITG